jgi:hypothetical protein
VPFTDRLSEETSWWWLAALVVGHVLWWAASWVWLLRAKARGRPSLLEGEGVVEGRVVSEAVVLVGEPFELLTDAGERVRVHAEATTPTRTATVRPWDEPKRLQPGERLAVRGTLAREVVDGADGYRAARTRWAIRASGIEAVEEVVPEARTARRARLAMAAAAASTGVLGWSAWDFVVLSLAGEPSDGVVEVIGQTHTGVVPRGRAGHSVVTSHERVAVVRVALSDDVLVFEERLTEPGYRALVGADRAPVIVSERLGLRIAQLGERPGIPALLPYLGLAELAGLLFALWMGRESAQRMGRTGATA